jgi:hypothetical protein
MYYLSFCVTRHTYTDFDGGEGPSAGSRVWTIRYILGIDRLICTGITCFHVTSARNGNVYKLSLIQFVPIPNSPHNSIHPLLHHLLSTYSESTSSIIKLTHSRRLSHPPI